MVTSRLSGSSASSDVGDVLPECVRGGVDNSGIGMPSVSGEEDRSSKGSNATAIITKCRGRWRVLVFALCRCSVSARASSTFGVGKFWAYGWYVLTVSMGRPLQTSTINHMLHAPEHCIICLSQLLLG